MCFVVCPCFASEDVSFPVISELRRPYSVINDANGQGAQALAVCISYMGNFINLVHKKFI